MNFSVVSKVSLAIIFFGTFKFFSRLNISLESETSKVFINSE
ncbi:hypothetical protein [Cetobacterium somerae]|nr:hypothetical protein [Cetobacterium somerae]